MNLFYCFNALALLLTCQFRCLRDYNWQNVHFQKQKFSRKTFFPRNWHHFTLTFDNLFNSLEINLHAQYEFNKIKSLLFVVVANCCCPCSWENKIFQNLPTLGHYWAYGWNVMKLNHESQITKLPDSTGLSVLDVG